MEYSWIKQFRNIIFGLLILSLLDKITCNTIEHNKLIISPPVSEVVRFANDSHFVTCTHKKGTSGTSIHWFNPRGKEINDKRGRIHVEDRGTQTVDNLALVFEHISTADKGNWTCDNKHDGKTSFKMIVNEPISFMDTPPIQSAREDKDATILCEVKGDPEPSVSWYYNGRQIILPGPKYTKLADGLVIKKVSKEDSGEYTCKAFQISTQISNVQEKTILLVIQHKPFVKKPRINAFGYMHGVTNLTCEALAEPSANFTWYRNGKKISGKHYPIHHGQHVSILSVTIANSSAFGEYKCKASNSMGNVELAIKLEEGVKPDPPAVFFLRGVNSDTLDVDVGATKNPGVPNETDIIGYRFEIVTAEDFEATETWEKARQIDFPVEDGVTYLLTQLPEDTKFLVRVASRNAAGLSDWAPFKIFATLPLHPHGINGAVNLNKSINFLLISMLFIFNGINR